MGTDTAHKQVVSIQQQMVCSNCGRNVFRCVGDKFYRVRRCDVFEHHFEPRKSANERRHDLFYKHRFSIENVDLGIRHLAMNARGELGRCPSANHRARERDAPAP